MNVKEKRLRWFHRARFGMFISWGLYSVLERGEWVMYGERIPRGEYAELANRFNPPKGFSPGSWIELAKEAGMKYVVLTTRHHEGFCLFDSKVSDFTSVKTASKRDFAAEYVKAARKAGLKVGFYYSLLDWRFPGYFNRKKYRKSAEAMIEQAHAQVRELMTNYGKIDYLFYDGEWVPGIELTRTLEKQGGSPQIAGFWRAGELNAMVRKCQPHIIINNRTGLDEDVDTPEHFTTASQKGRVWETCMTIGDQCGWGYIKNNPNLKTSAQLIQHLVTTAAGEGNFLLNIGPRPNGTVRKEERVRLKEIGRFLGVNGEAVYGSERCPILPGMAGATTAKGNVVYLHIFRWPGREVCVAGVANRVSSAKLLGSSSKLKISRANDGRLIISGLPESPPNVYDCVVAIKVKGKPRAIKDVFIRPL